MLLATEPNQLQQGIRRLGRIGGHASRDLEERVDRSVEVARGNALTKQHDIASSRTGSARDNEPLNAGLALPLCQILARGMVVRNQLVRRDPENAGLGEVNLDKGPDVDSKGPRSHAKLSKVVDSP